MAQQLVYRGFDKKTQQFLKWWMAFVTLAAGFAWVQHLIIGRTSETRYVIALALSAMAIASVAGLATIDFLEKKHGQLKSFYGKYLKLDYSTERLHRRIAAGRACNVLAFLAHQYNDRVATERQFGESLAGHTQIDAAQGSNLQDARYSHYQAKVEAWNEFKKVRRLARRAKLRPETYQACLKRKPFDEPHVRQAAH